MIKKSFFSYYLATASSTLTRRHSISTTTVSPEVKTNILEDQQKQVKTSLEKIKVECVDAESNTVHTGKIFFSSSWKSVNILTKKYEILILPICPAPSKRSVLASLRNKWEFGRNQLAAASSSSLPFWFFIVIRQDLDSVIGQFVLRVIYGIGRPWVKSFAWNAWRVKPRHNT